MNEPAWGSDPGERFVRVMAAVSADGVWDRAGAAGSCDELPISTALIDRIRAWQNCYDEWDASAEPPAAAEDAEGFPADAFSREGGAIAQALRDELPGDWTVVYQDITGRQETIKAARSRSG